MINVIRNSGLGNNVTIEDKNIYGSIVPGVSSIAADSPLHFFQQEKLTDGEHMTNLQTKGKLPVGTIALIYGLSITKTSGLAQDKVRAFYDADPYLEIKKNGVILFEERFRMIPEEGNIDVFAHQLDSDLATLTVISQANLKNGYLDITTYNPITGEREPRVIEGGIDFSAVIFFKSAFAGFAAATDKITLNMKCQYIQQKKAA